MVNETNTFLTILNQLDISQLEKEISLLNNSIKHLIRSNQELEAYIPEIWATNAITENKDVIAKQQTKVNIIIKELEKRNTSSNNNVSFLTHIYAFNA
ncbi:hypothetical protein PCANB_001289 [Pneumocystis canis]|nr:hypothetical protein PCANB_001289 [Pneumocystis canis]